MLARHRPLALVGSMKPQKKEKKISERKTVFILWRGLQQEQHQSHPGCHSSLSISRQRRYFDSGVYVSTASSIEHALPRLFDRTCSLVRERIAALPNLPIHNGHKISSCGVDRGSGTTNALVFPNPLGRVDIPTWAALGARIRRFAPLASLQITKAARTQAFTWFQSRSLRWPMTVSSERCVVST